MLILTRELNEKIIIGDDIEVMIVSIKAGKVQLGITAPIDIRVDREEVRKRIKRQEAAKCK